MPERSNDRVSPVLIAAAMLAARVDFARRPHADAPGGPLQRPGVVLATCGRALTGVLAALQVLLAGAALGAPVPGSGLVLVGGVLMVADNVLDKLPRNHLVGFFIPWAVARERVWDPTHRFGGKAGVVGGAGLMLLSAAPLSPDAQDPALVATCAAVGATTALKSWRLWRALKRAAP